MQLIQAFFILTSAVVAVEVRVEPLAAHLGDLLHVVGVDGVHELLLRGLGVGRLQGLLVHLEHLVHATLVLQLEREKRRRKQLGLHSWF